MYLQARQVVCGKIVAQSAHSSSLIACRHIVRPWTAARCDAVPARAASLDRLSDALNVDGYADAVDIEKLINITSSSDRWADGDSLEDDLPCASTRGSPSFAPSSSNTSSSGTSQKLRYSTIMLKLSGEALSGARGFGVDTTIMNLIAQEVAEVAATGVRIAVVVGGGNYFRGASAAQQGLERATADYVGMLATVMNCLQLQVRFLIRCGVVRNRSGAAV